MGKYLKGDVSPGKYKETDTYEPGAQVRKALKPTVATSEGIVDNILPNEYKK